MFSGLQQKNESSWPLLQATLQQMQRLPCPALPATVSATRTVSRSPRPTSSSLITVRLRLRTLIILSLSLLLSRSQQLVLPVFKLTVLTSQCSLFLSLLLSLQLSSLRPWRRGKRNFRGLSAPTYIGERSWWCLSRGKTSKEYSKENQYKESQPTHRIGPDRIDPSSSAYIVFIK